MLTLLAKIIPLGLASALSPVIIALAIAMLGRPRGARPRLGGLLGGGLIVGLALGFVGLTVGRTVDLQGSGLNTPEAVIDLALGGFFLYFALRLLLKPEGKLNFQAEGEHPGRRWLGLSLLINATNFDAVFLTFAAAREVGGAAVGDPAKILLIILNLFFFTLPVTLPIFVYLAFPKLAKPLLARLNRFLARYSRYAMAVIFLVFAALLIGRALRFWL